MRNIDLHMHSTYSDGTYTPSQLVNYAKQKGLSALSLTDHDTIDGLDKAKRQSDLLNIQFINGVEINSFYYLNNRKINIHVLGYAFVPQKLEPYMAMLKTLRHEHNEAIIHALHEIGINISYADMDLSSKNHIITRLNFAKVLVKKGYATTINEALTKYLHKGGTAYVDYNNHPFSVVAQKIHEADGIVSLAHPGEYKLNAAETESLIVSLKKEGLDAIECIHPSQDTLYAHKLMDLAKLHDLKLTGGSDFHGKNDDAIDLGLGGENMSIPESFLDNLHIM